MLETPRIKDKAGKAYWSSTWEKSALPPAIDPYDRVRGNFVVRHFHSLFSELFSESDTRGASLLEIGCARSVWLPYFAKQFGFKVSGIDKDSWINQSMMFMYRSMRSHCGGPMSNLSLMC